MSMQATKGSADEPDGREMALRSIQPSPLSVSAVSGLKSPAEATPFFCLMFAYSDPKPNIDNRASGHSVRAVARDYAHEALCRFNPLL